MAQLPLKIQVKFSCWHQSMQIARNSNKKATKCVVAWIWMDMIRSRWWLTHDRSWFFEKCEQIARFIAHLIYRHKKTAHYAYRRRESLLIFMVMLMRRRVGSAVNHKMNNKNGQSWYFFEKLTARQFYCRLEMPKQEGNALFVLTQFWKQNQNNEIYLLVDFYGQSVEYK